MSAFCGTYRFSQSELSHYSPLPASLLQMDEDYDDFSEVPKILRYAYNLPVRDDKLVEVLLPPKKRHRKLTNYSLASI